MSQTIEAKLFFGFTLDVESMDEAAQELLTGTKWSNAYAAKKGLVEPPYTAEKINDWRAWELKRKELIKGLDIDHYYPDGDDDDWAWYVCSKQYSVYKDGAEALDTRALTECAELTALLKDFCEAMGIAWKDPQWHLVCYREH